MRRRMHGHAPSLRYTQQCTHVHTHAHSQTTKDRCEEKKKCETAEGHKRRMTSSAYTHTRLHDVYKSLSEGIRKTHTQKK